MATLTGQPIDQSYSGLLKTTDNAGLEATAKAITDGIGGATNQEMSNTATNFVSGTVDFTGATVSGLPDNNTTYTVGSVQDGANADIKLTDQLGNDSKVTFVAGTNITLSNTGNDLTINAAAGTTPGLVLGTGSATDEGAPLSMVSGAAVTTVAAQARGGGDIAIGDGAITPVGGSTYPTDCIAIGHDATVTNEKAMAFGKNARAQGNKSFAAGYFSLASGNSSTAIGKDAEASGTSSSALGDNATATATGSVAIGEGVTAATANTVSVKALETQTNDGVKIKGDGTNAGKLSLYCEDASGAHNVTLEGPAHAGGSTYALKFPNVQSTGTQILEADASGNLAWINTPAAGSAGLVVGTGSNSLQNAVGTASTASGNASIALGKNSTASGPESMAYGEEALASGTSAAAFGQYAEATSTYAISFGRTSTATADGAVAFGQQTSAGQAGAVAMGRQVTTDTADTTHVRALKIVGITFLSADGTAGVVTLLDTDELALDGVAIGATTTTIETAKVVDTNYIAADRVIALITIPANTYKVGDTLNIQSMEERVGIDATQYTSLWYSDTAQTVGNAPVSGTNVSLTQIQTSVNGVGQQQRTIRIHSATDTSWLSNNAQSAETAESGFDGQTMTSTNIDWTATQYIYFQLWSDATAGTFTNYGINLHKVGA